MMDMKFGGFGVGVICFLCSAVLGILSRALDANTSDDAKKNMGIAAWALIGAAGILIVPHLSRNH